MRVILYMYMYMYSHKFDAVKKMFRNILLLSVLVLCCSGVDARSPNHRHHLAEEADFAHAELHRAAKDTLHLQQEAKHAKPSQQDAKAAFDVGKPIVFGADPKRQDEPYSFEDIFDPNLRPRSFGATWMCTHGKPYI